MTLPVLSPTEQVTWKMFKNLMRERAINEHDASILRDWCEEQGVPIDIVACTGRLPDWIQVAAERNMAKFHQVDPYARRSQINGWRKALNGIGELAHVWSYCVVLNQAWQAIEAPF